MRRLPTMGPKKILIIEDESKIRQLLRDYLEKEGYVVIEATDGQEGLKQFEKNAVDLILLDLMLPVINGWQICEKIREQSGVPIIMLTAKDGPVNQLKGYDLGANDYIEKPFNIRILIAKIQVYMGMASVQKEIESSEESYNIGDLKINVDQRQIRLNDEVIPMTHKEFDLLLYLTKNKKQALSRQQILDHVWGVDYVGTDRTIDACIKRIRIKLKGWSMPLVAVRGVGYRMEDE